MASPTIGNKTFTNPTPGATSYTQAHTQNSGNNRGLLVSLALQNGIDVSSVTYNGASMTQVMNVTNSSLSQRMACFFLVSPDAGAYNIVINFSGGSLWSPLSIAAYSFTDCGGYGSSGSETSYTTPSNISLSCSEGSYVMVRAQAFQAMGNPGITIGGVSYNAINADFQHNTNSQAWGKLGTNAVTAGTVSISSAATSGNLISQAIEIKGVSATRRIFIM